MAEVTLRNDQWRKIRSFLYGNPKVPNVYVGQQRQCPKFVEGILWLIYVQRTGQEAAKPGSCCFKAKTGATLPKTAEIEPSALSSQCLDRRIESQQRLEQKVTS